jgi:ParB family transcriptional regulator, chromosome partitioning protein
MMQLVESVKERGVITPATVRQKEDGRYELVSGHRRKRACELAGFETLRSEIVDLNRDEATILMVESNFQRSEILPSEKAFAYKMRLEALRLVKLERPVCQPFFKVKLLCPHTPS